VTSRLSDLAALAKVRISLLATLSTATGWIAMARALRPALAAVLAGTLLLAAGAAALNEVLDRERDGRMERTRDRPIPSGRIGVGSALLLAMIAAAGGTLLLWRAGGAIPALLGLGALTWYDAVYTPLKRVTAFAVLPGAIVGALPPAIGWTAAGGSAGAPRLHALCAFFLLWQVPHFWLLLLRRAEDFERGGFPTPARLLSGRQLGRITRVWTLATAGAALLLPVYGVTTRPAAAWALVGAVALLIPFAARLPGQGGESARLRRAFAAVNLLALAVMIIVALDGLA
jgi:heme o synthase